MKVSPFFNLKKQFRLYNICLPALYSLPFKKILFYFKVQSFKLIIQLSVRYIQHLFVCLGFIIPHENLSLIYRRHHYRWRATNFDLCSAPMVIKQWGFFSVPHLLRHGASVYNGHLRGPVTFTPIAVPLAVELLQPVFTT